MPVLDCVPLAMPVRGSRAVSALAEPVAHGAASRRKARETKPPRPVFLSVVDIFSNASSPPVFDWRNNDGPSVRRVSLSFGRNCLRWVPLLALGATAGVGCHCWRCPAVLGRFLACGNFPSGSFSRRSPRKPSSEAHRWKKPAVAPRRLAALILPQSSNPAASKRFLFAAGDGPRAITVRPRRRILHHTQFARFRRKNGRGVRPRGTLGSLAGVFQESPKSPPALCR